MSHGSPTESPLQDWLRLLTSWPPDLPRRGVIVTSFGEQVPFESFSLGGQLVLLQRPTPDSLGARTVIIPLANVAGLKIIDVVKPKVFEGLGFSSGKSRP